MKRSMRRSLGLCVLFIGAIIVGLHTAPAESWEAAFARMPLAQNVRELNRTNAVSLMLASFRENDEAKALIFMPGATDELYFFNRGTAKLTKAAPTLWDAIAAYTNQTLIQVSFRRPYVLLHSMEDPLDCFWRIEDERTAERIRKKKFIQHALYDDRDWDFMHPLLSFYTDTKIEPGMNDPETNHFYRHSFAGWNLTAWEALEAASLAGKTTFIVKKKKLIFQGDKRFREKPPVPDFP